MTEQAETIDLNKYFNSINFIPMFMLEKKAYSTMFHVSMPTIDARIRDDKWVEGKEYVRAEDGTIHILILGVQKWAARQWESKGNKVELMPLTESCISDSGGTTQTKARTPNTGGRSTHVRPILKAIE